MTSLDDLNAAPAERMASLLDGVFEHAPWVPLAAAGLRPFATVTALHAALMAVLTAADAPTQRRFLQGHPPLSAAALAPNLTAASAAEQAALGLAGLGALAGRFTALSAEYEARHGFPFIICARRHTPSSVLDQLERRIAHDEASERAAALAEVFLISRLRLVARVIGPGMPATTGTLALQLRDGETGQPAEGVRIELLRDGTRLLEATSGADGTIGRALIEGEPLRIGPHELRCHVAGYLAARQHPAEPAPWFDMIPLRFLVSEPEGEHRIVLNLSPRQFTAARL